MTISCFLQGSYGQCAEIVDCIGCHTDMTTFEDLGLPFGAPNVDYDGDGAGESFQHEIDGMEAALLAAMQTYASNVIGTPIGYSPASYPYFFVDTNGNGIIDPVETTRYSLFDDKLLRAAYNLKSGTDPCSDMHNFKYVLQTLYDSIQDLGGNVLAMKRP